MLSFIASLILVLSGCGPSNEIKIVSSDLTIEPGIGLGPIKFGMPMDDVIPLLGEPDQMTGKVLHYQDLGIAVIPSRGTHVGALMMGDSSGGFLVDRFKGKTKNGIGMKATKEAIVSAFGSPEKDLSPAAKMLQREEAKQGYESLSYDSGSLKFVLKDKQLVHITIRDRRTQGSRMPSD